MSVKEDMLKILSGMGVKVQDQPNVDQKLEESVPLKKDEFTPDQVRIWRSRCKTANKFHRKQFMDKYKVALKRYASDIARKKMAGGSECHSDIPYLFNDIEDFNSSIFYKNPRIDLTSRDTTDIEARRNIENLEQLVNDQIKDNASLKSMIRACLVDEGLSGMSAAFIDYDYRKRDNAVEGYVGHNVIADEVVVCKILPQNLIRPPAQCFYNYQNAPYLGYVELISIEDLRRDPTFDQEVVSSIKGQPYATLLDVEEDQLKKGVEKSDDELMYAKIYFVWIKGFDGGPLKKLVLSDDNSISKPLFYGDWDRPNGRDGRGYPIHVLMLNDPGEGFCPPSEAWILEPLMVLLDYLWEKQVSHLKRSHTRTLVKVGKDGLKKTDIFKWVKNEDLEILGLNNLAPGIDIRSLVFQLQDQPLSQDHIATFDLAKRILDEVSRKPGFTKAAVLERQKTASEAQEIRSEDMTITAYKVDKFKDWLKGLFFDWAKLVQVNYQDYQNVTVLSKESGVEEPREIRPDTIQGGFNADIEVESFMPPNRELKRRIIKEAIVDAQLLMPMLKEQGKTLNAQRLTEEYFENLEFRDSENLLVDIPLRDIDRQVTELVTKGIPMNPNELGENYPKALQRLLEIFADEGMMQKFETLLPGVGAIDGPLANFMRALEPLAKQQSGTPSSTPRARTDLGSQSAMSAQSMTA